MGLKIGFCGVGRFARRFVRLFKAHPLVDEIVLADLLPDRLAEQAKRFGIQRTVSTLDELCQSDVDAIAIFSQRWMHGPQGVQALRAGKHVFTAVPMAIDIEEVANIIESVKQTGLIYMVGETSYYYPATIYCRGRFEAGDFGRLVYAEGEYLHDMDHGFYDAYENSGGPDWKRTASFPPMFYPTHSIGMIRYATGVRMARVACLGQVDQHDDGVFRKGYSMWDNDFSNETALMQTTDGMMVRINEFRRVGISGYSPVRMSLYGTEGSFEEQTNAKVWNTKDPNDKTDLWDLLTCKRIPVSDEEREDLHDTLVDDYIIGTAPIHPEELLPPEFLSLPNGHEGSHQFLVCEFVDSVVNGRMPHNNVWESARNCVPGIVAHESARRGGEWMDIPDFGDAPS